MAIRYAYAQQACDLGACADVVAAAVCFDGIPTNLERCLGRAPGPEVCRLLFFFLCRPEANPLQMCGCSKCLLRPEAFLMSNDVCSHTSV